MMLQIMEKRSQMMKSWGHSANNDAAAFRIMEAGKSDDNLRELIEKESERKQENEREAVPVEELRGDRTVVFHSHTWEPRTDTGVKPYQGLTEPEILTRNEWPHPNSLWKPIVWYWRTMQWKGEFSENDEIRLGHTLALLGLRLQTCNNGKGNERHSQEHFTWLREECFRHVSTKKNTKK